MQAEAGHRVLDVGCGPAELLKDLPVTVDYIGYDMSEAYIETARKQYGDRAQFVCRKVDQAAVEELGPHSFDRVVAHGLLHHLNDDEAVEFFRMAESALKPGGRLVTLDGCYVPEQSRAARWFLRNDRGKFVRNRDEYARLAQQVFSDVKIDIRHDMYRIPYTLILIRCIRA